VSGRRWKGNGMTGTRRAVHAARAAVRLVATRRGDAAGRGCDRDDDRGDVPGWVLITLMTAGLVVVLWGLAETSLTSVFTDAMNRVQGR